MCHLMPDLFFFKSITFFSIIHFTQWLKRDCLHNKCYAISQINNTLAGGKITKSPRFSRLQIWFQKPGVCKNCTPPRIFLVTTDTASAPEDAIRNSVPLRITKRQPRRIHNLPPHFCLPHKENVQQSGCTSYKHPARMQLHF